MNSQPPPDKPGTYWLWWDGDWVAARVTMEHFDSDYVVSDPWSLMVAVPGKDTLWDVHYFKDHFWGPRIEPPKEKPHR